MKVEIKNIIDKKTLKVVATSYKKHSKYKKYITSHKSYLVGYDGEQVKVGQIVQINQSRPLSKRKRWKLEEGLV